MLLQKALRELDGEIQRLSRVRAIVAGLHTTRSLTEYVSSTPRESWARDEPSPVAAAKVTKVKKLSPFPDPLARTRAETKSPLKAKKRGALKDVMEVKAMSEPLSAIVASGMNAGAAEAGETLSGETAAGVNATGVTATNEPRKLRRLRFERATRTRRAAPPEARALGGTIPVRPVFISSANATPRPVKARASESGSAHKSAPALAPEGTLDALLRELSYRPSQGA